MQEFYRHSGRVTPASIFLALILGSIAAAILGVLYAIAINYIPVIQINFVITCIFGAAVGLTVNYLAYIGKMRNNVAARRGGCSFV